MKYAIVGGDTRSVFLARELSGDGSSVFTYALEKGALGVCTKCSSLLSCLDRAYCVVLPVPVEKNGRLNTPLSDTGLSVGEVLRRCSGQSVVGGMFSMEHCSIASEYGVYLLDIMKDEAFVTQNALLTAEAALGLIITQCDRALTDSRVLVCGYGRIGRALSEKLRCLGSEVTVGARCEQAKKVALKSGLTVIDISQPLSEAGGFDLIVNTVPSKIISDAALCTVDNGAVLMELASPPGGFDRSFGENIGLKIIYAPGLPGRLSPRSSAHCIKEYIVRQREE